MSLAGNVVMRAHLSSVLRRMNRLHQILIELEAPELYGIKSSMFHVAEARAILDELSSLMVDGCEVSE